MFRKTFFILLMGLLLILPAGCNTAPQFTKVEGTELDQVLQFSEPMADNFFAALNAGDYPAFSRDFSPELLKAVPESGLTDLKKTLSKVRAYQSRTVDHVDKVQTYYSVFYNAKFEQDMVTVRLTFDQAAPHKLSGTWFNSPKLAK